ncbi:MAG: nucleotide exchange factor GrpE [Bacteroides sp.]|nr:nucleotide exchange factor GrpE [Bacteroides sp.]MDE6033553.1 nucleotide exchange factor GrpE [Muribaculaceae bacterium]MBD5342557.1 nucleotide exchange factor GrpE [Bacteroides sp.]MBD5359401.1 nucleotide exchange factor GrpE [Bacteroides sp.]MBD5365049.1 nucleotide exchange factor GrpE [Bacteroides sp.]
MKRHKKFRRNMDQNQNNFDPKEVNNPQDGEAVNPEDAQTVSPDEAQKLDEELNEFEAMKKQLEETKAELDKEKREYLFLMAEFDNFRKRTLREKSEILRNGAESAMKGILPIVDDFERGLEAIKDTDNAEAVKEGMVLIYNKFVKYLEQNGVKAMESTGADFNDELHEAVALVPGQPEQKGKVIDTLEKGYMLNDKVLRHAKVAVGQ